MGLYVSLYCSRCLFLHSSPGTKLWLLLFYFVMCSPPTILSFPQILASVTPPPLLLCLLLLCVLTSVTALAPLQQRSLRVALSKLGCGQASEEDGCRGKNIGLEYVGGAVSAAGSRAVVLTPCQSGCLSSSSERQGGGERGGSALTGSNLRWQIASM